MFKSIKKRLKDQRGLTLVELLAVVVILGIIAGIAVPNIGKIIDNTEKDAQVAEGIQIIQAAKLYSTSTKLDFASTPVAGHADVGIDTSSTVILRNTVLGEYLDNIKDNSYLLIITKDATGKFSYSLKSHDSVSLVDGIDKSNKDSLASETELLAY